jgi:hypothetical protein
MKPSRAQIDDMRHALGLSYEKRTFRNYYATDEAEPSWEDLVAGGLAVVARVRDDGSRIYAVRRAGLGMVLRAGESAAKETLEVMDTYEQEPSRS